MRLSHLVPPGRSGVRLVLALVALATMGSPSFAAETGSFARIDAAVATGALDHDGALVHKFRQVFAPKDLPLALRPESPAPVRCLHPLLLEYRARRDALRPEQRATIDAFLTRSPAEYAKASYVSPGGNFEITYSTSGANGVPALDVDPANGVPDFVERIAQYCDDTWTLQVEQLGFAAPNLGGGRYQIAFENMGSYGYTTTSGAVETRIVLHNNFLGFPPNQDPEGNPIGAAKVTVAHEFKHATQFAASNWSEGGWLELDATWFEDVEYDYVNDYYNYLPAGSPISQPSLSLDAGGTGSYEDCVWQHHLSETFGNQIVLDYWNFRSANPGQTVLASYDAVLITHGSDLTEAFATFTGWNYATGSRGVPGFGYGEANSYPTAPVVATVSSFPALQAGTVEKLAANFVQALNFSGSLGTVDVVFTRNAGSNLQLSAVIRTRDGSLKLERIALTGNVTAASLASPLEDIVEVGFAVSNPDPSGPAASWELSIAETVRAPQPLVSLDVASVVDQVLAGDVLNLDVAVMNAGEPGSTLDYQVVLMESVPTKVEIARNIAGSTLTTTPMSYAAGQAANLVFTVTNGSIDEEWLTLVQLTVPAGVTVNSSTDLVGGSDGPLVSDGATGDGVTLTWADLDGNFGNVHGGEQAAASVNLSFDAALTGDLVFDYTIEGDQWGGLPHSVAGTITLTRQDANFQVLSPNGGEFWATPSEQTIQWTNLGSPSPVTIDLSRDGGASWEAVASGLPDTGSYAWSVNGPPSPDCRIRIRNDDGSVIDVSDA
ncbi:MAG: hypothetical protein HKO53_05070, partial [Gemmatimonadetes bacterium]|nr:hypothetical protein [Gemmatimonadota bacterium]